MMDDDLSILMRLSLEHNGEPTFSVPFRFQAKWWSSVVWISISIASQQTYSNFQFGCTNCQLIGNYTPIDRVGCRRCSVQSFVKRLLSTLREHKPAYGLCWKWSWKWKWKWKCFQRCLNLKSQIRLRGIHKTESEQTQSRSGSRRGSFRAGAHFISDLAWLLSLMAGHQSGGSQRRPSL